MMIFFIDTWNRMKLESLSAIWIAAKGRPGQKVFASPEKLDTFTWKLALSDG
jgi:hypothetical protein